MATQQEEEQAKDFLKRAEIITMKKDLQKLREADALKERDKIVRIKTLEEQKAEEEKKLIEKQAQKIATQQKAENAGIEKVLSEKAAEERVAEKDIKSYAQEQEKQQIFLLESQRFGFENQIKDIEEKKEPELKLEKNRILLEKGGFAAKLNSILEQEKKLEEEQKFIAEKEQTTSVPAEKKALEKRRWEIDSKIQEIEKKRWEAEKQIQNSENKIKELDINYEKLETEKNGLRQKVLGIDKSLRGIYSAIIERIEAKRRGQSEQQKLARESLEKTRAEGKEKIQREQWRGQQPIKNKELSNQAPQSFKNKLAESFAKEDEQRKKFLEDIEKSTNNE